MSYEDGSWMNRIYFPTSKLYILEILDFRSTLRILSPTVWSILTLTLPSLINEATYCHPLRKWKMSLGPYWM